MNIRYQNGDIIEGTALFRTADRMRIAVRGKDDALDLTSYHGTWITDECEPVFMETGITYKTDMDYSDEAFICPQSLADHLVSLLVSDPMEELMDEQTPLDMEPSGISTLIA